MRAIRMTAAVAVTVSMFTSPIVGAQVKVVKPAKVISAGDGPESVAALPDKTPQAFAYPDAAVVQTYQDELMQIKRVEDAERRAVKARDDYERRKSEAEREMASRKYKIEGLKLRQDQLTSEMQGQQTELKDIEKNFQATQEELSSTERYANEKYTESDKMKADLDQNRKKLEASVDQLKSLKELTQKNINKNGIEIQRMNSEVAALESEVEALDAQKVSLQADELQVHTEWMAIKSKIEEKNTERQKRLAELNEAKKKYQAAQNDFHAAQMELASAEKFRNQTDQQVSAEMKKLDQATFAAQRGKAMAEAEKIRLESETEKLKYYASSMKKTNIEALDAMKDAQTQVMESRLALETAKSELAVEVSGGDKVRSKYEKNKSRIRGLAAVAESSEMMDGGKAWTIAKNCNIYKRMSNKAEVIGEVTVGQKLVASPATGLWIKVLNSSGGAAFVKSDCGQFE